MHTHAHSPTPRHAQASRKAIKQMTERLRRDQREHARELQARADRHAIPRNDEGPPPRID
jgi:hypothetical protein